MYGYVTDTGQQSQIKLKINKIHLNLLGGLMTTSFMLFLC